MEKIFNSPFIIKLQEIGQKVAANKFLSAIQTAMCSLMSVIMVGAICVVLNSILGPNMLGIVESGTPLASFFTIPYSFTMNMLGLWTVMLLAYNYARNIELKSPLVTTVNTLVIFCISASAIVKTESGVSAITNSYFGAQGMFPGFLITLVAVRVEWLCEKYKIYIRLPDAVPPAIQGSFAAIVPLLFNVAIFSGINAILLATTGGTYNFCSGFMALIAAPLSAVSSLPGIILMYMLASLLWCFGIHGSIVIGSIVSPILMAAFEASGNSVAAGGPAILAPVMCYWYYQSCGGAGNTLVLCLMGLNSKSEQIKAVSRAGIGPACFGINEPVTFGLPIMYNPIMMIPYILIVPVCILLGYGAMSAGIIATPFIYATGLMPIGMVSFMRSLDIRNAIFDWLLVIPCGIIYYPFFKAYEKQLVERESAVPATE